MNKYVYLVVKQLEDKTVGTLIIGDKSYETLELPYINNQQSISSIMDDVYELFCDYSPGKKRSVIELMPKNNRSQIQLHYAKNVSWLEGCIGVYSREIEHRILVEIIAGGYTHLIKKTI